MFYVFRREKAGTDRDSWFVHHNQFVHTDLTRPNKMPFFSFHGPFPRPGRASISDNVQPFEQVDRFKQPPLALHPGGQRHHGKVRRRGQAAASVRETYLPAEDQHT